MNKIIKVLISVLFTTKLIACSCDNQNLETSFMKADFVAKVRITKIYKNINNNEYYKADIKIEELFKGLPISSILIYGNNGRNFESTCDIFIDKGANLILYLQKNKLNKYSVHFCTRKVNLLTDINKTELQILKLLKDKNYNSTSTATYASNLNKALHFFNKKQKRYRKFINCKKEFAVYELTLNENKVKCIQSLLSYNTKTNHSIKKILKSVNWKKKNGRNIKSKKLDKILIVIYCSLNKEKNQRIYYQKLY